LEAVVAVVKIMLTVIPEEVAEAEPVVIENHLELLRVVIQYHH
tara:strand:- start:672 stop:800 length:129 start_codon:yes stop_codon:yes gene_type:complete